MKKIQIQSYVDKDSHEKLKKLADADGLSFASFVRKVLLNFLKQNKDGK